MVGDNLDLSSQDDFSDGSSSLEGQRSFLGVNFACCGIYSRVYVNKDRTAYSGNCPKCGLQVSFRIGSDGTGQRFFTVY